MTITSSTARKAVETPWITGYYYIQFVTISFTHVELM